MKWHALTYHQRMMVRLIAWEGLSVKGLAARLRWAYAYVKWSLNRLYHQLGIAGDPSRKLVRLAGWAWRQPLWQSEVYG